jgi:hypothetical protein
MQMDEVSFSTTNTEIAFHYKIILPTILLVFTHRYWHPLQTGLKTLQSSTWLIYQKYPTLMQCMSCTTHVQSCSSLEIRYVPHDD